MQSREVGLAKIREYNRNYRRSKLGVITNMYGSIKCRSKKRNKELSFDRHKFVGWCIKQAAFNKLYNNWARSGFRTNLKPSVDRINPLLGYTWRNIQIITWAENSQKGYEEMNLTRGRPVVQYSENGVYMNRFWSSAEAAKNLNLSPRQINDVLNGRRTSVYGFRFIFDKNPKVLKSVAIL